MRQPRNLSRLTRSHGWSPWPCYVELVDTRPGDFVRAFIRRHRKLTAVGSNRIMRIGVVKDVYEKSIRIMCGAGNSLLVRKHEIDLIMGYRHRQKKKSRAVYTPKQKLLNYEQIV